MAKFLILAGILMVVAGVIIHFSPKIPFLGKLPGDLVIDRGNFRMYIPITTSILISLVLSIIIFLIQRIKQ